MIAGIGQLAKALIQHHFRHILEFYICLGKGEKIGTVSYDERERNILIETDVVYAVNTIEKLIHFLTSLKNDHSLLLMANYSKVSEGSTIIQTSFIIECAFALNNTVHHLAIVKVAFAEEKDKVSVNSNYGIALSTIRYRKLCVQ